jgi:hypothetical protein
LRFHNSTFNSLPKLKLSAARFAGSGRPSATNCPPHQPATGNCHRQPAGYLEAALPGFNLICSPT